MTNDEIWKTVRIAFLMIVDIIERTFDIRPPRPLKELDNE
jgi:hypothetical protein